MNIQAYSYNEIMKKINKILSIFLTIIFIVGIINIPMVIAEEAQEGVDYTEYNKACLALLPTDVVACPDMTARFLNLTSSGDHSEETITAAKKLVAELTADCETESQKAIAIRHWVCETIDYSLEPHHTTPHAEGESCPGIISCIIRGTGLNQGSCGTFSGVYSYLLTAAGIANGELLIDDPGIETDHAMNVVFADGKWYTVDAEGPNYGSFDIIHESGIGGKGGSKIRDIFFANNDKYFLIWDSNNDGVPELDFVYYIIEHEHIYSEEPVSVTEPTCSRHGEAVYQCTTEPEYCKKKKRVEIPLLDHEFESEPHLTRTACYASDADYGAKNIFLGGVNPHYCDYDTLEFYRCSNPDCSGTLAKVIPATGGHLTETVTKEPNCINPGKKIVSCSDCDYSATVTIPATGHDFSTTLTVNEPTCTKNGSSYYKCNNCDTVKDYTTIPTLGHNWKEVSRTKATCLNNEEIVNYECNVCHATNVKYNYIDVAHTPSEPDEFGFITCTVCGCYISNVDIPNNDPENNNQGEEQDNNDENNKNNESVHTHNFTKSIINKVATCVEKGSETHYCACGKSYTVDIAPVKHKCKWSVTVKATYFSAGKKGYKCSVCKKVFKTKTIGKLKLATPKFSVKSSKKMLKVAYKKALDATGYQVKYKIGKKSYTKTYRSAKASSKVFRKLKVGTYKVYVRAFTKQNGKTAYSAWSKAKVVKVK